MNRLRLYERKSMQVKPDEGIEVIPVRKSWFLDKERYIRIRRNFLGMKMGYNPTDKKIDWLLRHLRCDMRRTNNYRKGLMQVDVDILTAMKEDLAAGTLELDNYTAEYEELDQNWMRWPTWPKSTMLFISFLTATALIVGVIGGIIAGGESVVFFAVFAFGMLLLRIGKVLPSENVLRRSRDKTIRLKANIAQWLIIGTFLGMFFWACLSQLIGIFRLLLY